MKESLTPDTVLIACGLPASYKTETTEVIAKLKGFTILRTDMLRLEVLRNEDIFDEKVAANMEKRTLVYDEMFRMAEELAGKGHGIILDATFVTQSLRRRAAAVAARHGKTFVIQQTQCPQEVSLRRISARTKENYESNALTEQAYLNNKKKFEPVDLEDLKRLNPGLTMIHLRVDTSSDAEEEWFVVDRVDR
jgi:predicted kinase